MENNVNWVAPKFPTTVIRLGWGSVLKQLRRTVEGVPVLRLLVSGTKLDRTTYMYEGIQVLGEKIAPELLATMMEQAKAGRVYLIENHGATIPMGWSADADLTPLGDGNQELFVDFRLDMDMNATKDLVRLIESRPDYEPQCSVGLMVKREIRWDDLEGGYVGVLTEGHFEHVAMTRPDHAAYPDADVEEVFMTDSFELATKELVMSTAKKILEKTQAERPEREAPMSGVKIARVDQQASAAAGGVRIKDGVVANKEAEAEAKKEAEDSKEATAEADAEAKKEDAAPPPAKPDADEEDEDAGTHKCAGLKCKEDGCKNAEGAVKEEMSKEDEKDADADAAAPPPEEEKDPKAAKKTMKEHADNLKSLMKEALDENADPEDVKELLADMHADMEALCESLGVDPDEVDGDGEEDEGAMETKDEKPAAAVAKTKPAVPAAKPSGLETELVGIMKSFTTKFDRKLRRIDEKLKHLDSTPATPLPRRYNDGVDGDGDDASSMDERFEKILKGLDPATRDQVTRAIATKTVTDMFVTKSGGKQ